MTASTAPSPGFAVAACRPDQAEEYVATHIEVMCDTYRHLPGGRTFAEARRAEVAERVERLRTDLAEARDADAAGRAPFRRHLVGLDAAGQVVAVASGGCGVEAWERAFDPPIPPPGTPWCLSHLYLRPPARGSGLATALMDAALAGAPSAYLWVYPDNPRAVAFYLRHGFAPDGVRITADPDWGAADIVRMLRPTPTRGTADP